MISVLLSFNHFSIKKISFVLLIGKKNDTPKLLFN